MALRWRTVACGWPTGVARAFVRYQKHKTFWVTCENPAGPIGGGIG
jgi:hypothetical protein